mmetsp:Transcript_78528/g.227929  ORF Transcript_78528/g.227929 Transcript_78528/m.227929 type:complete len:267 (+) Transcript_78528:261-1061(+)
MIKSTGIFSTSGDNCGSPNVADVPAMAPSASICGLVALAWSSSTSSDSVATPAAAAAAAAAALATFCCFRQSPICAAASRATSFSMSFATLPESPLAMLHGESGEADASRNSLLREQVLVSTPCVLGCVGSNSRPASASNVEVFPARAWPTKHNFTVFNRCRPAINALWKAAMARGSRRSTSRRACSERVSATALGVERLSSESTVDGGDDNDDDDALATFGATSTVCALSSPAPCELGDESSSVEPKNTLEDAFFALLKCELANS